jgi:hypothetical protein
VVPWQNDHGLLETPELLLDKQHCVVGDTIMVEEVAGNQHHIDGLGYGTVHNGLQAAAI